MRVEIEFMDHDLYQQIKRAFHAAGGLPYLQECRLNIVAEFENVIDFKLIRSDQSTKEEKKKDKDSMISSDVFALCAFGENRIKVFPNSIVLKNTSFQELNINSFKAGGEIHFKIEEREGDFSIYFANLEMVGSPECLKNFRYEPFYLDAFGVPFSVLEDLYEKYANSGSFKSLEKSSKFDSFEYQFDVTDLSFQEEQHYLNFEYGFSKLLNEKRRAILKALYFGQSQQIMDACRGIIGLGNGLTPSGDDYLCGLFGVLIADKNVHERFFPIYEQTIEKASKLTNEISYSYLCELKDLKYKPDFIEMLKLFSIERLTEQASQASSEEKEVPSASTNRNEELIGKIKHYFLKLLEIGHFSGTDLLTGMMDGLVFLKRQGIKEFKMVKRDW